LPQSHAEKKRMANRRVFRLFVLPVLLVLALGGARADAASLRLVVGAPIAAHGALVYPLEILAKGTPVVAVLPYETREGRLEVNGVVRESVGRDVFFGQQPFAHGGAGLVLSDLRPGDRVDLRVRGTRAPPRILVEAALSTTFATGLAIGLFLGLLVTAALSQIVAIAGYRDVLRCWYLGALILMICCESARSGLWHLSPRDALPVLFVCGLGIAISMVGFSAAYLRLYANARILLWTIIVANVLPPIAIFVLHAHGLVPERQTVLFAGPFIGNASLVIAAALRWRAGFKPASLLLLGLCAICSYFATSIVLDLSGGSLPFFDWWGWEIAIGLDVLLLFLGIAYRERFSMRSQSEIELELRAATFAAAHDPLTGVPNRRGLEAWIEQRPTLIATLLYLDIDGFKAVNDRGGHAAGDDTLRLVARIIRHAVREGDQFARMGGDEFLVVLVNVSESEPATDVIERISTAVGALRPLGSDDETRIGMSIGVGHLSGAASFPAALREADADLYRWKSEHHAVARMQPVLRSVPSPEPLKASG